MGNVHIKDKKISIIAYQEIVDDAGDVIEGEAPLYENIWAYYRQASGNEIYLAAQVQTKIEVVFEISWKPDIDTNMKVRYKGQDYNITRIDDFEGGKNDLKIYAYKYS